MEKEVTLLIENAIRNQKIGKALFLSELLSVLKDKYSTKQSTVVIDKTENLLFSIGNIEQSQVIITTYYDTGMSFLAKNYDPSTQFESHITATKQQLLLNGLHIFFVAIILFFIGSKTFLHQPITIIDSYIILAGIIYFFSYRFLTKAQEPHAIRNNVSILTALELLEQVEGASVVLTDNGFDNMQGDRAFADVLKRTKLDKLVIMLDCIGADSPLQFEISENIDEEIIKLLLEQDIQLNKNPSHPLATIYQKAIRIYPIDSVLKDDTIKEVGKENMKKVNSIIKKIYFFDNIK